MFVRKCNYSPENRTAAPARPGTEAAPGQPVPQDWDSVSLFTLRLLWAVSRGRLRCSRPQGKAVAPLGQHRLWPWVPFQLPGISHPQLPFPHCRDRCTLAPPGHWRLRAATPASGLRDDTQATKLIYYCHLPGPHCPL